MVSLTQQKSPPLKQRKGSAGFTLIELLTVVAIIGVLAAIAIPTYNRYIDTAKMALAHGVTDSFRKELEMYQTDYQRYPANIDFVTGKDDLGVTIFQGTFLEQLKGDLSSIDSYVSDTKTYTLTVRARNKEQTVITVTPENSTY